MDIFASIVLAVVQGITAWIPVSSKTQVLLVGNWFYGLSFTTALAFALILHLGDFLAAIVKYRTEYVNALGMLAHPKDITSEADSRPTVVEGRFLILSIIASAVVALPAYELTKKYFTSLSGEPLLFLVGLLLIGMAVITFISRDKGKAGAKVSIITALVTGAAQGLAVIPGISRSGITECSLLLQGVEQQEALRLSFLMSAPMILASFAAFYLLEGFAGFTLPVIIVGVLVSAVISYLTMDVLTALARKIPAYYFLAAIGLLAMVPMLIRLTLGAIAS